MELISLFPFSESNFALEWFRARSTSHREAFSHPRQKTRVVAPSSTNLPGHHLSFVK
jgi:hypothetical protein